MVASKVIPPSNPQNQIQGSRKQDSACRDCRSCTIIAGEKGSRILRVGQWYVEDNALQDTEDRGIMPMRTMLAIR